MPLPVYKGTFGLALGMWGSCWGSAPCTWLLQENPPCSPMAPTCKVDPKSSLFNLQQTGYALFIIIIIEEKDKNWRGKAILILCH